VEYSGAARELLALVAFILLTLSFLDKNELATVEPHKAATPYSKQQNLISGQQQKT
jgi:hypothetical protein